MTRTKAFRSIVLLISTLFVLSAPASAQSDTPQSVETVRGRWMFEPSGETKLDSADSTQPTTGARTPLREIVWLRDREWFLPAIADPKPAAMTFAFPMLSDAFDFSQKPASSGNRHS